MGAEFIDQVFVSERTFPDIRKLFLKLFQTDLNIIPRGSSVLSLGSGLFCVFEQELLARGIHVTPVDFSLNLDPHNIEIRLEYPHPFFQSMGDRYLKARYFLDGAEDVANSIRVQKVRNMVVRDIFPNIITKIFPPFTGVEDNSQEFIIDVFGVFCNIPKSIEFLSLYLSEAWRVLKPGGMLFIVSFDEDAQYIITSKLSTLQIAESNGMSGILLKKEIVEAEN